MGRVGTGRSFCGSAVHDPNRWVEGFQIDPMGADDGRVMPTGDEHDRGVDDVSGASSTAKHSGSPRRSIRQWFNNDVVSIDQPGESRLTSAPSPHLAYNTRRHHHRPMLLSGNLNDRGRVPITALDRNQRSGIENHAQRRSAKARRRRAAASSSSVNRPPVSSKISARTSASSSPSTRARPASFSHALSDLALPSATSRRARSATAGSRLTVTLITVILLPYQLGTDLNHFSVEDLAGLEETIDALSDPDALADVREADQAYARGDLVRGIDVVRRNKGLCLRAYPKAPVKRGARCKGQG